MFVKLQKLIVNGSLENRNLQRMKTELGEKLLHRKKSKYLLKNAAEIQ